LASGVSPDVWADQDWRTICTAVELLDKKKDKDDGRVMSG
jgi:hypothetical protein